MFKYSLKRFLTTIPVLFIAITFAFFTLRLAPGGPFDGERAMPAQVKKNLEKHYHLDKPIIVQYGIYIKNVLKGDLGPSFNDFTFSVNEKIAQGLPYTLKLGGLALLVAVIFGTLSGMISAYWQNSRLDYIIGFVVLLGLVIPNFLMAPILQEFLANKLNFALSTPDKPVKIFMVRGWGEGSWANLTLPVIVLALSHIARISRLMRASMIEVLNANYIRTARAKGIGVKLVMFRHTFRQAFIPVLSYLGPAASYLLTGSLVVEMIFGLPGIGRLFIDSALNRDYGMVLGTVIFYMILITFLNLVVDLLYAVLDPKLRVAK